MSMAVGRLREGVHNVPYLSAHFLARALQSKLALSSSTTRSSNLSLRSEVHVLAMARFRLDYGGQKLVGRQPWFCDGEVKIKSSVS